MRRHHLCNRLIDYISVPLVLLCGIFGQFVEDDFQTTPESKLSPEIFQATRGLANEMAYFYENATERRLQSQATANEDVQDVTSHQNGQLRVRRTLQASGGCREWEPVPHSYRKREAGGRRYCC